MKLRHVFLVIATVVIGYLALQPEAPAQQPPARKTLFSTLRAGQTVSLKLAGNLYEISTLDLDPPLTHQVVEIADDFIVLREQSELVDYRIPATGVRAVIHVKTKK